MFLFTIEASSQESHDAFTNIMKLYGDDVLRVAYLYVRDKQRSEDICQDVFVKALIKKVYLFPEDKQKAWLMKVTANTSKNHLKSYWNKNVDVSDEIGDEAPDYQADNEIEGRIIQKENKKSVVNAIYELPLKYKEIIILYYYQEFDTTQIAQLLKLPKGTVKSRFMKARELLGQKLSLLAPGSAASNSDKIIEVLQGE